MGFWDRVKAEVKGQRTTQEWVSEKAGINYRTFYGWIAKDILPRGDEAVAIAKALGVTVEYLVTGTDSTDPWIHDHRQLIDDLKALRPDQLATLAAVARVQVEANGAEPARKLPDFEAGIRLAQKAGDAARAAKAELET